MITEDLRIVRGLPSYVQDPQPAEQGFQFLSLTTCDGQAGFRLATGDFVPQVAALKNGGSWDDASAQTGRELRTSALGNVRESIKLKLTGGAAQECYQYITALNRMAEHARSFSTTFYDIEPVYLMFKAVGAPGHQYAIIYNIENGGLRTLNNSTNPGVPHFEIDIIVEREPAWRAIPPGLPASAWANEQNPALLNVTPSYRRGVVLAGGSTTIKNFFEYFNNYSRLRNAPRIKIDAADIPGDAPAMVQVDFGARSITNAFVWRTTKPSGVQSRSEVPGRTGTGQTREYVTTLNGADGTSTATLVTDAKYGLLGANSATQQIMEVNNAGGASGSEVIKWPRTLADLPGDPGATYSQDVLDINSMRGKFNIFVRGRQVGGSAGDIQFSMTFDQIRGTAHTTRTVDANVSKGVGELEWTFLDTVQLPFDARVMQSARGEGILYVGEDTSAVQAIYRTLVARLNVTFANSAKYRLTDVVFIPYDEALLKIEIDTDTARESNIIVIDSAGYLSRGGGTSRLQDTVAGFWQATSGSATNDQDAPLSVTGQPLTLIPGVDNYINIMYDTVPETVDALVNQLTDTFEASVFYIPRWYGIRDK